MRPRPHLALHVLALCLLGLTSTARASGHKHEHGAVTLNVAVEPQRITLQMSSPLDNLIGFEHVPRTPAERQRVDGLVSTLQAAADLFRLDPQAGCRLERVELSSAVLGLKSEELAEAPAGPDTRDHGDLDAQFAFACSQAARAKHVDLGLWAAFTGVQRVDVQIVTPQGQSKQSLRRPDARLLLSRGR